MSKNETEQLRDERILQALIKAANGIEIEAIAPDKWLIEPPPPSDEPTMADQLKAAWFTIVRPQDSARIEHSHQKWQTFKDIVRKPLK